MGEVSREAFRHLIVTGIFLGVALAVHVLLEHMLRHAEIRSPDLRRRWRRQLRTGTTVIVAAGLSILWASELRLLAVSFVAIAVAIVVATKELIMCVSGSLLKIGARAFVVGDRIEVDGLRGDVVDQTLLATTIMEVGPGQLSQQRTGRRIVLPNSLFLARPLVNDRLGPDYVLHVFSVPLRLTDDWQAAERILLDTAVAECQPFLEDARRQLTQVAEVRGLDVPTVDPRVTIQLPAPGELNLVVRLPVVADQRSRAEQAVLRTYLQSVASPAGRVSTPVA